MGFAVCPSAVNVDPLVGEVVVAPDALNDLDRLVEERVALCEIDAERLVLTAQVAGGDGQDEPSPREGVQGGGGLGDHEGIAIGQDQDVRNEAQPIGDRGAKGECGKRVEGIVAARPQPSFSRDRMIGEPDPRKAGRLCRHAESRESVLGQEGRIVGMPDDGVGHPKIHVGTIVGVSGAHPILLGTEPGCRARW